MQELIPTFACPWCGFELFDWWKPAYDWYECEGCGKIFRLVDGQEEWA